MEAPPQVEPDAFLVEVDGQPHWLRGPYLRHARGEASMLERLLRVRRALLPEGGEGAVLLDGGANLGLSAWPWRPARHATPGCWPSSRIRA